MAGAQSKRSKSTLRTYVTSRDRFREKFLRTRDRELFAPTASPICFTLHLFFCFAVVFENSANIGRPKFIFLCELSHNISASLASRLHFLFFGVTLGALLRKFFSAYPLPSRGLSTRTASPMLALPFAPCDLWDDIGRASCLLLGFCRDRPRSTRIALRAKQRLHFLAGIGTRACRSRQKRGHCQSIQDSFLVSKEIVSFFA
jgi:hypothetical protein